MVKALKFNHQPSKPWPYDGHPFETHYNPGKTRWGCTHLVSEHKCLGSSTQWRCVHILGCQTPLETSRALQQAQSTRLPPEVQKRCAHRFPVPSLVPNHKVVTLYKGTAPAPSNVGCCSELENGCVYIGVQLAPYSGHLARAILKRKRRQSWTRKIKNWSLTF